VLVQGPLVRAQALPPSSDQILSLFAGYLEALRTQAGIPGIAAAVVGDSNMLWAQSFGLQDIESSARTRTDALFHFDGLTQLVTASMVLQCAALFAIFVVQEARLRPDQPVTALELVRDVLIYAMLAATARN